VMPGIDGIAFLRQAMIVSPRTTRILLTGYTEAVSMAVVLDRRFLFYDHTLAQLGLLFPSPP
jgi:response regulator RpfG family c-di-GMP phosphodiesterase